MALLKRRAALSGGVAVATGIAILTAVFSGRKPRAVTAPQELGPDEMRPLSDIAAVDPSQPLPALSFRTLDGKEVTLAQYKGRPVVLNFWATWCGPCVKEMPELDRLAALQGPSGIAVLAVSADRTGAAAVRPFLAAHDVTHATILLDQSSDAVHALGAAGFPTTLIIDGAGRLRGRLEGPANWGQATAVVRRMTL